MREIETLALVIVGVLRSSLGSVGVMLLLAWTGNLQAQVPSFQQLQLPPPSDGGPNIQEFVTGGAGSLQGFAGLATILNGSPVILYDPAWLQWMGGPASSNFRFTRAHEYAHHRLGHAFQQYYAPPHVLPMLGYQSELEADCAAVRVLTQSGDQLAVGAGFSIYQQVLPAQDMHGRPGAAARLQNMQACLHY